MPARLLLRLGSRRGSRDALVICFRRHYCPGDMLLPRSGSLDHLKQGNRAPNSALISAADARRQKQAKASKRCCVFHHHRSAAPTKRIIAQTASHQRTSGVWNVRLGTWRSVLLCAEWVSTFVGPSRRAYHCTLPSVIPAERLMILLLNLGHTTSGPQWCETNAMRGGVDHLFVSHCCGNEEVEVVSAFCTLSIKHLPRTPKRSRR